MRRLVIAYILPCYAHAVEMVVHERDHTMLRRYLCGIHIYYRRICAVAEDELFTPVAEEVSLQTRIVLCPVVCSRTAHAGSKRHRTAEMMRHERRTSASGTVHTAGIITLVTIDRHIFISRSFISRPQGIKVISVHIAEDAQRP